MIINVILVEIHVYQNVTIHINIFLLSWQYQTVYLQSLSNHDILVRRHLHEAIFFQNVECNSKCSLIMFMVTANVQNVHCNSKCSLIMFMATANVQNVHCNSKCSLRMFMVTANVH